MENGGAVKMEIIQLTKDSYSIWDKFCLESDDAWFWHTTAWLEYTINQRPTLKTQNSSFFVYKKNKIVAVVPLTIETKEVGGNCYKEFSFCGSAIPVPALDNDLDNEEIDSVREHIFNEIDMLAAINKIVCASFKQVPLANNYLFKTKPFNYLLKYGFVDVSLNTQLIDLSKSEEELWDNLRRNHRRNIKKNNGLKTLIFTSENITRDVFLAYKEMHHKAAGRKTRPDITFELMFDWLKQGIAFLVAVVLNDKQVGFEYYSIYKNNVYGFSAANDPDYEYLPIRHLLEWDAILWMKKQGLSYYEIGLQQYGVLPHDFPDKKQIDISHFKRGFGGLAVPVFIGEKYYSKEHYNEINDIRKDKFLDMYEFDRKGFEKKRMQILPNEDVRVFDENDNGILKEELEQIVFKVLNDNKGVMNDMKSNPKAINHLVGKVKKHLGKRFNYQLIEVELKKKMGDQMPL